MSRNLDIASLRSFVTVIEQGGVTRAAEQLHLTQSAVSMQIKRLEESLGLSLLRKVGRGVAPTSKGEELARYAKRVINENDQLWNALTVPKYEGVLRLGVPHDIVYPNIPKVLRSFDRDFPSVQLTLEDGFTIGLKDDLRRGKLDVVLSTEPIVEKSGEELSALELAWMGAHDGSAWTRSPLPLGNSSRCIFRSHVVEQLERDNIPWETPLETDHEATSVALAASDRSVVVLPKGTYTAHLSEVAHGNALPPLPEFKIGLYLTTGPNADMAKELASYLRAAYS